MITKQELEKEFRELEVYADNLRKSNEQIQRSLDETNEQLIYSFVDRLATVFLIILAEADVYPFDSEFWTLRGLAIYY